MRMRYMDEEINALDGKCSSKNTVLGSLTATLCERVGFTRQQRGCCHIMVGYVKISSVFPIRLGVF